MRKSFRRLAMFACVLGLIFSMTAEASACPLLSRLFGSRGGCGSLARPLATVPAPQQVPTQSPVITTVSATAPSCANGQCGNQAFQIERPRFRLFR